MWRGIALLVTVALVTGASLRRLNVDYKLIPDNLDNDLPELERYVSTDADKEYIRHIHSMSDSYRGNEGSLVIETNALIDTKYRTWKRNADIINSLLALPKGMNEAGR